MGQWLGDIWEFESPLTMPGCIRSHILSILKMSSTAGREEGHPGIIMTKEGWFWLIAINEAVTSIGFVASGICEAGKCAAESDAAVGGGAVPGGARKNEASAAMSRTRCWRIFRIRASRPRERDIFWWGTRGVFWIRFSRRG